MNATTIFGVVALTFMMAMYSLERRHRAFTLAFACGCLFSSAYGFLIGAWPFRSRGDRLVWCCFAEVSTATRSADCRLKV
jgi:hypothetical protein